MTKVNVACIQMCSTDEVGENINTVTRLIRQAKQNSAELIATPEMTSLLDRRPGALLEKTKPEEHDEALSAMRALAAELDTWILVGSLAIRVTPVKCANRSFLISPRGTIEARYDKIHMFDVGLSETETYKESEKYIAGDTAVIAHIPQACLGMTVCYDLRFPQLYRALAKSGAEIFSIPSSFTRTTGEAHWHVLLRARAIESGCFVIAPAQGGTHADGRETYGHSLIVDPWGTILAEGDSSPGIVQATLDLSKVVEARKRIPSLQHDRDYAVSTIEKKAE